MKRILLLCLTVATISVNAQKLSESKVPEAVKTVFTKGYPATEGKWAKVDGNYEVSFDKDAKKMTQVIKPNGNLVQTEYAITVNELPKTVLEYLNTHYKGVKITEVAHLLKPNGDVQYETVVKGKDVLFDKDGKFIKVEE
ncbi:MAG: PepSY-like domain-containing protein [Alphaproteobacteria bacterium]